MRVEDADTVRARLIRWPTLSPDGKRLVFGAMNRLYIMDLPSGTPRLLTQSTGGGQGGAGSAGTQEGEFMPAWSPDGQSIAYVTWTTTGGHIKRVAATGGAPQNADDVPKATISIRRSRPTDRASCSSAARPPISSIRSCSTRRRPMTIPMRRLRSAA